MRILSLTAVFTLALDQLSKLGIIYVLNLREWGEIDVVDPFLNFRWAENRGINFGLLSSNAIVTRWILIVMAVAISAWVVHWVWRGKLGRLPQLSAGLLVGGALGNVVDRLAYGYVADFLNMSCCGIENPYSFNIADIAVFAGAAGLVLFSGKPDGRDGAFRRKTP